MLKKYEDCFIQTHVLETFKDITAVISEYEQMRQTPGNKKEYLFMIHHGFCLYTNSTDIPSVPLYLSR